VRDNGLISCTVTIDEQTVGAVFAGIYERLAESVKIPGFRRGKAPRNLLRRRLNMTEVRAAVLQEMVPRAMDEVMEKYGLRPLDTPSLEDYDLEEGRPLVFRFSMVERPSVRLGEYKGLPWEPPEPEDSRSVDDLLNELRSRRAKLEPVQEPAGENDVITGEMEFHRSDGNFVINEAARLDLSNPSLEKDLRANLIGIEPGGERNFEVRDEEGNVRAKCRFKAAQVLRKTLPEIDDAFATALGAPSLEALRADLQEQLRQSREREGERLGREALLKKVVENSEVDVPVYSSVKLAAGLLGDYVDILRARGVSLQALRGEQTASAEQVFLQALGSAQEKIREQLVVEEIARCENVSVAEEESGEAPEESREGRARRRAQLLREKVVELLYQNARREPQEPAEASSEAGGAQPGPAANGPGPQAPEASASTQAEVSA